LPRIADEKDLAGLLALKPTDAEGRKLRDSVALDCRGKLLAFLKRRDAGPTNNESERALPICVRCCAESEDALASVCPGH
jgi:hypothetical protein